VFVPSNDPPIVGVGSAPQLFSEARERTRAFLAGLDMPPRSPLLTEILCETFETGDLICAGLLLWATDACGGDSETALAVAASLESFHRFNVLHDELTEGIASRWGLPQTLNAGDAAHAQALCLLAVDRAHPQRALRVGVMLTRTLMRRLAFRSAHGRNGTQPGKCAQLRRSLGSTEALLFEASLRAGATLADAPDRVVATLARAGRLLGVARRSIPDANDYAERAVTLAERAGIDSYHVDQFKEIAYHLVA
jgi:geranylgeranyl pyrophosphate synthase